MALKDWKNQRNRKDFKIWRKKGTEIQLVYSDQSLNGGPENNIYVSGKGINKDFKTKSQALKFAKSYMRKH